MRFREIQEAWSKKYKKGIDCSNPKGFSQKAHCQGKKKKMNEENHNVTRNITINDVIIRAVLNRLVRRIKGKRANAVKGLIILDYIHFLAFIHFLMSLIRYLHGKFSFYSLSYLVIN